MAVSVDAAVAVPVGAVVAVLFGTAVVGAGVVGTAVVGTAVVGIAVVGTAVAGIAVAGTADRCRRRGRCRCRALARSAQGHGLRDLLSARVVLDDEPRRGATRRGGSEPHGDRTDGGNAAVARQRLSATAIGPHGEAGRRGPALTIVEENRAYRQGRAVVACIGNR